MQPVNIELAGGKKVIWAKDQPEYLPLPSVITNDGRVITKWKFSWKERIKVLVSGILYHEQLNFNMPLQAIKMGVVEPSIEMLDETALSYEDMQSIKAS